MNKNLHKLLKWLILLLLTGITAGVVASLLIELIRSIQTLSFGYNPEASLKQDIRGVAASRRFLSVLLAGFVAAFGWHLMAKKMQPLRTIKEIIHDQKSFNSLTHFYHGLIQLITVSMGSPLGREGAAREVATALTGFWLRFWKVDREDKILLLACSSGAALGAVYNAPLASLIFIIENIVRKWNRKNLTAAIIVSFVAVWTVRFLSGREVQYQLPQLKWNQDLFLWAIFATVLITCIILAYQKLLTSIPQRNLKSKKFFLFTLLAFSLVACLSIFYPHILGNGKAGLIYYLHDKFDLSYALGLLLAKGFAVYITFFAGAYGGRIAPSMMMGGGLALLLASFWNKTFHSQIPIQFAIIIGAAIFLAIINKIPLAATLFLIEISGQPLINALPVALAMTVAYLTQAILSKLFKKASSLQSKKQKS
ncbi:chloride channel protein [Streptococcus catagoni]|uniref:chloride channel protein n=1 Tax=Streptococcus catagoni TaxID=2654874 RepID=UPI00140E3B93|nr:chloride channel protein [Streptococcus catagoni]